ncbi:MAG: hypothetical protein ACOY90_19185 [Candidatus Zhuqueibacterota bacterium]
MAFRNEPINLHPAMYEPSPRCAWKGLRTKPAGISLWLQRIDDSIRADNDRLLPAVRMNCSFP